ncbi:hypothetical protein [Caballeronia sp. dw_19]|uniref:hypothetical protein n=1 Tax=Caballeronia sp. dw_19 TaxID=2719791 RepID=UPI001BCE3C55|nr:hypothetical protein [Caballeronia sp. dw_19]
MVTEARENELMDKAVDLLEAAGVPTMAREEASAFLTGVMTTAFMLLRTVAGDEYLRGWLAGASGDLCKPAVVEIRKPS